MIIDKIKIAGIGAYFLNKDERPDLSIPSAESQIISRTKKITEGKQWEISGINLVIEGDDLSTIWNRDNNDTPLFSISVIKEMFPGLLANPYQHRVHNIAGFEDLKRGTFEDCNVLEIDGIPTIVSSANKTCSWTSRIYPMPQSNGVSITLASWELAATKYTPKTNFTYDLFLNIWHAGQPLNRNFNEQFGLAKNLNPTDNRTASGIGFSENAAAYQLNFISRIEHDAAIYESHYLIFSESMGTPLLRAVNLLEPVESVYDFYSIQELISQASSYQIFDMTGGPIKKMTVNLDISAVLVCSMFNSIQLKYNDIPAEFIELTVYNSEFTYFEAKLVGMESFRPPKL